MERDKNQGFFRQLWDSLHPQASQQNITNQERKLKRTIIKNEKKEQERLVKIERGRLLLLPLPNYSGKALYDIPTFALDPNEISQLQNTPFLHRRLAEATITLQTTDPDDIGSILSKVPLFETSRVDNARLLYGQYAFSDRHVVALRDIIADQIAIDPTDHFVGITFFIDRTLPLKPVWQTPSFSLRKPPQRPFPNGHHPYIQ